METMRKLLKGPNEAEEAKLATSGQELAEGLTKLFRLTAGKQISVTCSVGTPVQGKDTTFNQLIIELTNESEEDIPMKKVSAIVEPYLSRQSSANGTLFRMVYRNKKETPLGK